MAGQPMTDAVAGQVQVILEAAERAAAEIQREVEDETARRAAAVRLEAERDAARIRAEAQAQAAAYLLERRQAIDAYARERIDQLTRLTSDLLSGSQVALAGIQEAASARRALEDLLASIAATAEAAAHVAAADPPEPIFPRRDEHATDVLPPAGYPHRRTGTDPGQ